MKYFLGIIMFAIGILMMKYTVQITNVTGKLDFAEKYLRPGLAGTYTWWRLLGLSFCILSILWMFGKINLTGLPTYPVQ